METSQPSEKSVKRRTFDKVERAAFWREYNGLCVHCETELTCRDMTLDHIVPRERANDADEFARLLAEYELQVSFDINAYYNFVPSHPSCNRRKSNGLFSPILMACILQLAAKKAPRVQKRVERHKKKLARAESGLQLKQVFNSNVLTKAETSILKKLILSVQKRQRRITIACRIFAQTVNCGGSLINYALRV